MAIFPQNIGRHVKETVMAQQTLKPDDLARMDPAQLIALTAPERLAEMKRPALVRLAKHLREARDAVENKAQRKDIAVAFRAANDEKQQRKAASEGEAKAKAPKGQKAVKGGQAAQKKGAGQKVGKERSADQPVMQAKAPDDKVAEQADVKVKPAKAKPADKQAEKAEAMRRREAEKAEKKRVRAAEKAEKQAGAKAAREAEKASRKAARIAARADNAQ